VYHILPNFAISDRTRAIQTECNMELLLAFELITILTKTGSVI
jgi:hypothetical protein